MTKNEVINELQYYQMYIGEIISCYYINEALCDFADSYPESLRQYGIELRVISRALVCKEHLLSAVLLCYDPKSKRLMKSIERILCEKISDDMLSYSKITNKLHDAKKEIQKCTDDISKLREFRNKVYAHFDQKIFDDSWQISFKKENNFNFTKIKELCESIFNTFSEILEILGSKPYDASVIRLSDVERFIERLK